MILLNFSHPLTAGQLAEISDSLGGEIDEVREISTQFDPELPFAEQVIALLAGTGLTPEDWRTGQFLINPPAHNVIALTLFAELHGRLGYFPAVIRLKPVEDSLTTQYILGEVINLQFVRDQARIRRFNIP